MDALVEGCSLMLDTFDDVVSVNSLSLSKIKQANLLAAHIREQLSELYQIVGTTRDELGDYLEGPTR